MGIWKQFGENGVGGNGEARITMIIGTVQVWFIRCQRIQLINCERELLWIKKVWLKREVNQQGSNEDEYK